MPLISKNRVTERLLKQIVIDVRMGLPFKSAGMKNRVSPKTIEKWRYDSRQAKIKDENGESLTSREQLLLSFDDDLAEAASRYEFDLLSDVNRATADDWRAAMELLKRRFRNHWGDKPSNVNISQSQGQVSISAPREAIQGILESHPDFIEFQRQKMIEGMVVDEEKESE